MYVTVNPEKIRGAYNLEITDDFLSLSRLEIGFPDFEIIWRKR